MTTRFRRRIVRRGPRRRTAWTIMEQQPANLAPTGVTQMDLTPVSSVPTSAGGAVLPFGMAREGMTLARILVDGHIYIPDIDGNPHNALLWYGLVLASEQEWSTTGAVPRPGQDDADWIWLGCKDVRHRSSIASGFDPASSVRVEYDSRAGRRMRSGDTRLVFILRNDNSSLDTVDSSWCIRTLWMLP